MVSNWRGPMDSGKPEIGPLCAGAGLTQVMSSWPEVALPLVEPVTDDPETQPWRATSKL